MAVSTPISQTSPDSQPVCVSPRSPAHREIEVALLTGGQDQHYSLGLTMALLRQGVRFDFIGSDEVDSPELHATPQVAFLNLRGNQRKRAGLAAKVSRVLLYYARLIRYAATAKPRIFHILWNNRFEFLDRTLLMLYYKALGKKIVFTAHNVNAGRRDLQDTLFNRLGLKTQYRLADRIFVHTELMKSELLRDFRVDPRKVVVIPYGINNAVRNTRLTPAEAKRRMGLRPEEKAILCFGRIRPYKGMEYLVQAFCELALRDDRYRLIIAGEMKHGSESYLAELQRTLDAHRLRDKVIERIQFIPDDDCELYFKAADVFVLSYTEIFQSGILFLGLSFGLPAIVADVGSLKDDVAEAHTGFVCPPRDSAALALAIERYFQSDLYQALDQRRPKIQQYAERRHSWDVVAQLTREVYDSVLGETRP